jgi:hypothetical protein
MTNQTFQPGSLLYATDLNALEASIPANLAAGALNTLPLAFSSKPTTGIYLNTTANASALVNNGYEIVDIGVAQVKLRRFAFRDCRAPCGSAWGRKLYLRDVRGRLIKR